MAAERGSNAENIQSNLQNFHSVSSSVRAGKWVSATLTTTMPKGLHNATAHNALRIYAWACDRLLVQHSNSISSMSMRKKVLNSHFKRRINKLRQTKLKKKNKILSVRHFWPPTFCRACRRVGPLVRVVDRRLCAYWLKYKEINKVNWRANISPGQKEV